MIIPNLMITDMGRSIAFYRDLLGMSLTMMVSADKQIITTGDEPQAIFATLDWQGSQLMLQTIHSLSDELPVFDHTSKPTASGTLYFRNFQANDVIERFSKEQIIKGPLTQWYGMTELYIRDPDGYVICLGAPDGAAPK